jgi:hypothetical protein
MLKIHVGTIGVDPVSALRPARINLSRHLHTLLQQTYFIKKHTFGEMVGYIEQSGERNAIDMIEKRKHNSSSKRGGKSSTRVSLLYHSHGDNQLQENLVQKISTQKKKERISRHDLGLVVKRKNGERIEEMKRYKK